MKVLLVEPPKPAVSIGGEDVFLFEPLALEYVGAGVMPDHDVKLLDMRVDRDLGRTLEAFEPDIVGFTGYTVHRDVVLGLAGEVKAWSPQVLTVVGGHHATVAPADFRSPAVDLVVIGDGVEAFRRIVRRAERGEDPRGIPGVAVVEEDRPVAAEPSPPVGLDELPAPRRELSAPYRRHYFSEWMQPLASIRTSRGCPFRCTFCALWKLAGGRYLRRAPECIVEELATLDEDFVFFADDESLVDVERMRTLARRIADAGIRKRFFLYGRSDTIARHPDLLEVWREVGLERVFVGLESFRDADLAAINKRSSAHDNREAVRVLHELGIDLYGSFIVRPEYGVDDFAALKDYCHQLEVDFASFAVLTPLPGTDLMDQVGDRLLTRDPAYFDFLHTVLPTRLPLQDFFRELSGLVRGAIPPAKQLALLRKFPLRRLPFVLATSLRIQRRLREAYRDYLDLPAVAAVSGGS